MALFNRRDLRSQYQADLLAWIELGERKALGQTLGLLSQHADLPETTRTLFRKTHRLLEQHNPRFISESWLHLLGRVDRLLAAHTPTSQATEDTRHAHQVQIRQLLEALSSLQNPRRGALDQETLAKPSIHQALQDRDRAIAVKGPRWYLDLGATQSIQVAKGIVSAVMKAPSTLKSQEIDDAQPSLGLSLFEPIRFHETTVPVVALAPIEAHHHRLGCLVCVMRTPLGVPTGFSHFGLIATRISERAFEEPARSSIIDIDWVAMARAIETLRPISRTER